MFLIFISSVLYFIKKINNENSANAAVIIPNGINIEEWIEVFDKMLTDEAWWSVDHQSTENLIIGILIAPKIAIIDEIFNISKSHSCSIFYPEDVVVGKNMDDNPQIKELDEISNDDLILDIGPKTINKIKDIIQNSKSVLWNGPAGYFENPNFAIGSYEIAKKIVDMNKNKSIYSVAGGGDTIAVLNQINVINEFNFVSTAGGAFLEYLEGKELPGIKALN